MIGKEETLSAVKTLLNFCNILLGTKVIICADHINNLNSTTKHASKHIKH